MLGPRKAALASYFLTTAGELQIEVPLLKLHFKYRSIGGQVVVKLPHAAARFDGRWGTSCRQAAFIKQLSPGN